MDAVAESPSRPHWLFNSEMARANAFKANKVIAEKKAKQAALLAEQAALRQDAVKAVDPEIAFREQSVSRVRAQLTILFDKLDKLLRVNKLDTKAVKETSEAITRLEAVEQKYSGRASPGSLRPSTRSKRERGSRAKPEVE